MTNDFHRTNINLRREDVDWLVQTYGYGWTEKVRDIVHDYVRNRTIGQRRAVDVKERMIRDLDRR